MRSHYYTPVYTLRSINQLFSWRSATITEFSKTFGSYTGLQRSRQKKFLRQMILNRCTKSVNTHS